MPHSAASLATLAGPAEQDTAPARLAHGLAICLAAYLYGSLPFVYLLGRRRKVNLAEVGSGNVGSANLWAAAGTTAGAAGWVLDASKGLLPAVACRRLGGERLAELAGVCGVAGQCWPIFLRFNGGRGISAFVGAAFQIDRPSWIVSLLPMIGGSLWRIVPLLVRRGRSAGGRLRASRSKAVPLGCALGVAAFPVACAARGRSQGGLRAPILLAAVILLRRLTAPLPDDAACGPAVRPQALVFRLLYDRNTSA